MGSVSELVTVPDTTYGFIGLGVMGYCMAQNLRSKIPPTSTLIVCDIVETVLQKFVSETPGKVKVAKTPREVAEQAEIVITMLPQGRHVKEVFTNPDTGLLSIPPSPTKTFVECSTIDVRTSIQISELVKSNCAGSFIDAPVSGGVTGARAGTLTFMVGGDREAVSKTMPVFQTMGKTIFHCGTESAGLKTKQINNYLSGVTMLGTAEAMNLGIKSGLDVKILADVINVSTGMCYNSREQNPVKGVSASASASNDFVGGFSIELCKGVLHMAVELAEENGVELPLAAKVVGLYEDASRDPRCAGKDFRSIFKFISDQ